MLHYCAACGNLTEWQEYPLDLIDAREYGLVYILTQWRCEGKCNNTLTKEAVYKGKERVG